MSEGTVVAISLLSKGLGIQLKDVEETTWFQWDEKTAMFCENLAAGDSVDFEADPMRRIQSLKLLAPSTTRRLSAKMCAEECAPYHQDEGGRAVAALERIAAALEASNQIKLRR